MPAQLVAVSAAAAASERHAQNDGGAYAIALASGAGSLPAMDSVATVVSGWMMPAWMMPASSTEPASRLPRPPAPAPLEPPVVSAALSDMMGLFWPPASCACAAGAGAGAGAGVAAACCLFLAAGSSNTGALRPAGCSSRRRPPAATARPVAVALGASVASRGPTRSSCADASATASNGSPCSLASQQPSSGWHAPRAATAAHAAASAHWQLRRPAAHSCSAASGRS